ncbi:hypothetical protein HPP92_021934 [Vanilla planifolia]|uniref:RNA polymerase II subunit B1 CTD phosphatase RPAP2 homolog n=1 Tax=Vanilla planifolia TaxID=51239 RepID=A0A835Q5C4_VANPL|nr:hypothetical protein HPP92_021934 [Vanilla planifolia]
MNFTSDIIIQNDMPEMLVKLLEDMVLVEKTSKSEVAPKPSKFKPRKKPANVTDTLVNSTGTIICSDEFDVVAGKTYSLTYECSSEVTVRSVDRSVDENRSSKKPSNVSKPKSKKKSMHDNCNKALNDTHAGIKVKGSPNGSLLPQVHSEEQDGSLLDMSSSGKVLGKELEDETFSEKKIASLKSSLKTSRSKIGSHSVKWADVEKKGVFIDEKVIPLELAEENIGSFVRLTSAEACAAALTQAAEIVASGKAEVEDAASEAGIVILPYKQSVQVERKEDEAFQFDQDITKWPKKTMLLDTDMFEVEDAWYDTPPEGFSLNLSPFATMWMALFGWITCSSLAYVYGRDDGSFEDFMEVNVEYPRKVILRDGQSLEIRQTLDGFISRILPELAKDFRLPTPISTLEKFLGCMIDTMSFSCAIPSLKISQWHVIVLLFLEALSVRRLPALAVLPMSRDLQLKQVLDAARISIDEYESMRDHILPLGRTWNAASSSVQSSTF